ncbi:MAG: MFS transporter [Anaerolineae bacterium]|nr:MFS transporter [Anaerolineae bacterium]NUQ03678.1 MFS transporter [Anaerolineae bacterium]
MQPRAHYRRFVLGVFFAFLLLHQADRLVIGQVLEDLQRDFAIDDAAAGAIGTGALVVATLFFPVWGYLYDRYARAKLLALASFIWGLTTMLGAVVTSYPAFLAARGSSGVDDSSYPGLYSLVSDYFGPATRGKINGFLQIAGPVGSMLSLALVLVLRETIGWRSIFLLTGGLGLVVGLLIFFGVRDLPRGSSEPEMRDLSDIPTFKFRWSALRDVLRRRAILPLFAQGFFGVFPFTVIEFWFFTYLGRERGFADGVVVALMVAAALSMSLGAVVGGALGDALYRRTPRGRLLTCLTGVTAGAVLLAATLTLPPTTSPLRFGAMLSVTAFFTLFSGPNIVATLYDITAPEVRSTTLAVQYFIENAGAAGAPLIVGILSTQIGLSSAILLISVGTLCVCAMFLLLAVVRIPEDVGALRREMRERAEEVMVRSGS